MEWKNKRCSLLKMVVIDKLCPPNIPSKPGWMDGYKVRLTSVTSVVCGKVKKKTMPERRRGNCQIEETRIILEVSIDNFFDSKVLRTVMHWNPLIRTVRNKWKCLCLKKEKFILNFNNKLLFHEIYFFLHMTLLIKFIAVENIKSLSFLLSDVLQLPRRNTSQKVSFLIHILTLLFQVTFQNENINDLLRQVAEAVAYWFIPVEWNDCENPCSTVHLLSFWQMQLNTLTTPLGAETN